MNAHTRAAAATLTIIASLALSVAAPVAADAKIKGIDGPAIAKIKDGPIDLARKPLPCPPPPNQKAWLTVETCPL